MRRLRHSPVDERRVVYMEDRVASQLGWYAGKSAANGRAAGRWFCVGLVLETAALGFAIFQITAEGIPDLVGLLAAVAIAATALTRLDCHDELSKSYAWRRMSSHASGYRVNPHRRRQRSRVPWMPSTQRFCASTSRGCRSEPNAQGGMTGRLSRSLGQTAEPARIRSPCDRPYLRMNPPSE
jgi:hypothetical protein